APRQRGGDRGTGPGAGRQCRTARCGSLRPAALGQSRRSRAGSRALHRRTRVSMGGVHAARLTILQEGAGSPRVRSTVSLVLDGDSVIVIDPGMAPAQSAILRPLAAAGIEPADVTDVIISHHHPDHTMNVGLFGAARVHDHWAIYQHDIWTSRPAEGFQVSP